MRKSEEKRAAPWTLATNAAIGGLIALGITLALLLGAAALVASGRVPEGTMGAVTVGVLFAGSVIGAVVAVKRTGGRAMIAGLAEGAVLYAVTFVCGAFSDSQTLLGEMSLFLLAAAVLGGAVGGMLCARPKKKRHA